MQPILRVTYFVLGAILGTIVGLTIGLFAMARADSVSLATSSPPQTSVISFIASEFATSTMSTAQQEAVLYEQQNTASIVYELKIQNQILLQILKKI